MAIREKPKSALGATAHWMAAVRAQESTRENPLVNDPLAAALAGEKGAAWLAGQPPGSSVPILLRTRFFDDFLQRAAFEHEIRQVVLLAAGLDTRAFRLNWPAGTRIFELEQPEVLDYKEEILKSSGARPNCERRAIPIDLTHDWEEALAVEGFDPERPSAWLVEGLFFYIPDEAIQELLERVSKQAMKGSRLGFDAINKAMLASPITRPWIDMQASQGAPWIGTLDDPEGALAALGWSATLTQAGQPDANYDRWTLPVFPVKLPGMPHNWFVTARKI